MGIKKQSEGLEAKPKSAQTVSSRAATSEEHFEPHDKVLPQNRFP